MVTGGATAFVVATLLPARDKQDELKASMQHERIFMSDSMSNH
jgi:hypothetical protein